MEDMRVKESLIGGKALIMGQAAMMEKNVFKIRI